MNSMHEITVLLSPGDSIRSLSLSLYHFLCRKIVGYEDTVKTIRMMNNVRDNLIYNDSFVRITSGSFGDGLQLKGSDIDVMTVLKDIEVHENMPSAFLDKSKTYFSVNMEDTKPGFTCLSLDYTDNADILQKCETIDGKLFLSSQLFKQQYLEKCADTIHGPCLQPT